MANQDGAQTTLNEMFAESKDQEIWVKLNLTDKVKKFSAVDIVKISENMETHKEFNALDERDKKLIQALILLYDNGGLLDSGTKKDNAEDADIFIKKFPDNFGPRAYWADSRF